MAPDYNLHRSQISMSELPKQEDTEDLEGEEGEEEEGKKEAEQLDHKSLDLILDIPLTVTVELGQDFPHGIAFET